jgi:hypothetical protein
MYALTNDGSSLIAASASFKASGKARSLVLVVSHALPDSIDLLGTSSVVEVSRVVWLSLDGFGV